MKHLFTLFAMVFMINTVAWSQATFVLDDFENGEVNFTTQVNVNPPAHMDIAVVDNPVKDAVNSSNKVWEWARYDAEAENKVWAGFYSTLTNEIPSGYHRIEIKYLRTNATSQLKIKPEGRITKEIASVEPASKTNEWEVLVFDIYAAGIQNINVFGFFPDFYEPIDVNAKVYIDDITIVYDPSIVPPPAPTSITLFDNSENDRFYDQSWTFKSGGSILVQEHWEGPDLPDGDKLPVVTSPVKSAPNAIKLQWKSVDEGDWGAMIASIGWTAHDVREMTYLSMWINSPSILDADVLPQIYFESTTGNPNKSGKLKMKNYVQEQVPANEWIEVKVPLADFWAADETFVSQEFIKSIFLAQDNADNIDCTLYIDDITFVKGIPAVVLFDDSENDRFYDQSFSTKTAPSTLVQEHWQGPDMDDGDKLPVVTTPVKSGTNALKLQWKSVDGGSWSALVAAIDWLAFDLTEATHIHFWVNSPAELAHELLPKVYLESHSGNPNKTGEVNLANYVADLAANEWTEVQVPLADFWAADPTFIAKDVVKGIFFEQNVADNAEHTMFMDEFKFITLPVESGLNDVKASNKLHVCYSGNILRINDYTGIVKVYNMTGGLVAEGQSVSGYMNARLASGIYIVKTDIGNAKFLVK